jgi:hypothetical protein
MHLLAIDFFSSYVRFAAINQFLLATSGRLSSFSVPPPDDPLNQLGVSQDTDDREQAGKGNQPESI